MIQIKFKGALYTFPSVIQGRFLVDKSIDEGAFGAVFDSFDIVAKEKCFIKLVSPKTFYELLDAKH
jgi:hypothetical protein